MKIIINKLLFIVILVVISLKIASGSGADDGIDDDAVLASINEVGLGQEFIQINSFDDLCKIGKDPAFPPDGNYELTADIDASESRDMNDGQGFEPIHTTGDLIFDGKGYAIIGLYINRRECAIGLFGIVNGLTVIRNLHILEASINGIHKVGGLIGSVGGPKGDVSITNSSFTGTVTGTYRFIDTLVRRVYTEPEPQRFPGLLVGHIERAFTENYTYIDTLVGGSHVGGLIGSNSSGHTTITRCFFTGNVSGGTSVGGLVGASNRIIILRSYSSGNVTGYGESSTGSRGGLVGTTSDNTSIVRSYSTANITGENVGGLIGFRYGNDSVKISQCYFAGNLTGEQREIRGLVGKQLAEYDRIRGWYEERLIRPRIKSSYWDISISGTAHKDKHAKTTPQMMRRRTFRGWDFDNVWQIDAGKGYPRLRAENAPYQYTEK